MIIVFVLIHFDVYNLQLTLLFEFKNL